MMVSYDLKGLVAKWKAQEAEGKIDPDLQHWFDIHDYYNCECGWTEAKLKPSKVPVCIQCGKIMKICRRKE